MSELELPLKSSPVASSYLVLKVETARWHQKPEDLCQQAVTATHPRSRERFMALYDISQGKNATQVSRDTGRNHQTVMSWVHRYNTAGPESLVYRHTCGHPPLCPIQSKLA